MRALIGCLLAALLIAAACGSDGGPEAAGGDVGATTGASPAGDPDEPVSDGGSVTSGGASASCVETYSLDNLKKRDFAFDGTAKSAESPGSSGGQEPSSAERVTFEVREWFKGGSGDEVTLQAYGFGGSITSAGGEPRKIGDRLLVAGDDDYLWECGFTQAYDADVATDWRETLR